LNIEKELIMSILKLTKQGSVLKEHVYKDAKVSREVALNLLKKLEEIKLIYLNEHFLSADDFQRLKLAVYAVKLGMDIENVCTFLSWQEFEKVTVMAFERNNYIVQKNLRFKFSGQKFEIDIVGGKKPLLVCVDCKHWHRGICPSSLKKIVEKQVERTFALSVSLNSLAGKFGCVSWDKVKLVPVVLSLFPSRCKICNGVPVVSIFQLQDFLSQLPAYIERLKHLEKAYPIR